MYRMAINFVGMFLYPGKIALTILGCQLCRVLYAAEQCSVVSVFVPVLFLRISRTLAKKPTVNTLLGSHTSRCFLLWT